MSLSNCLAIKFMASDLKQSENSHDGEVAVYMSAEFGLAGSEEHVEDWLERFQTDCHRCPRYVVTQWGQCLDVYTDKYF